jgi:peptidoglycan/LPS O-acetylase OafA/YrhL
MTAPAAGGPGAKAGETKRDAKLEGLRGYLALGVVVFHTAFFAGVTTFPGMPTKGIWTNLVEGLVVCLPPFFVLSGFFLYRSFARSVLAGTPQPSVRKFLWGRALRLIPAFWLVTIVALLTINLDVISGFWYVARPFLLIHFYWPGAEWITGIVPTWTVPAEMLYYLILPLVTLGIGRYARKAASLEQKARRMIVPLSLFLIVGIAWTIYTNIPSQLETAAHYNMWYWPFGYFDAFAIGMVFATIAAYADVSGRVPRLWSFVRRHPNLMWLGALVAFILVLPRAFGTIGMGDWGAFWQEQSNHVVVLLFSALFVGPLTVPGVRSRLMNAVLTPRPIRFVGRVSYGVYLWHMVVAAWLLGEGNLFGTGLITPPFQMWGVRPFWGLTIWTIVLTIVISAISYYALERPITQLRNKRRWTATEQRPTITAIDPNTGTDPGRDQRAA